MTSVFYGQGILFVIGISLIVYQISNQNIFWSGIILMIISIIWTGVKIQYDKDQIKREFR